MTIETMTTTCAACQTRGKTWLGSDPTCGFANGQVFSPDNWRCATLERLREICAAVLETGAPLHGVRAMYQDNDQRSAMLDLVELEPGKEGSPLFTTQQFLMVVIWYKNRGRTEQVWVMGDAGEPTRVTEAQVLAVVEHYEGELAKRRSARPLPPATVLTEAQTAALRDKGNINGIFGARVTPGRSDLPLTDAIRKKLRTLQDIELDAESKNKR